MCKNALDNDMNLNAEQWPKQTPLVQQPMPAGLQAQEGIIRYTRTKAAVVIQQLHGTAPITLRPRNLFKAQIQNHMLMALWSPCHKKTHTPYTNLAHAPSQGNP